jgi:hypothetical protein
MDDDTVCRLQATRRAARNSAKFLAGFDHGADRVINQRHIEEYVRIGIAVRTAGVTRKQLYAIIGDRFVTLCATPGSRLGILAQRTGTSFQRSLHFNRSSAARSVYRAYGAPLGRGRCTRGAVFSNPADTGVPLAVGAYEPLEPSSNPTPLGDALCAELRQLLNDYLADRDQRLDALTVDDTWGKGRA